MGFSGFRTRIVRVGEHADHSATTTTAQLIMSLTSLRPSVQILNTFVVTFLPVFVFRLTQKHF